MPDGFTKKSDNLNKPCKYGITSCSSQETLYKVEVYKIPPDSTCVNFALLEKDIYSNSKIKLFHILNLTI